MMLFVRYSVNVKMLGAKEEKQSRKGGLLNDRLRMEVKFYMVVWSLIEKVTLEERPEGSKIAAQMSKRQAF